MRRAKEPDYRLQRLAAELSNKVAQVDQLMSEDPELARLAELAELADYLDYGALQANVAAIRAADLRNAREILDSLD